MCSARVGESDHAVNQLIVSSTHSLPQARLAEVAVSLDVNEKIPVREPLQNASETGSLGGTFHRKRFYDGNLQWPLYLDRRVDRHERAFKLADDGRMEAEKRWGGMALVAKHVCGRRCVLPQDVLPTPANATQTRSSGSMRGQRGIYLTGTRRGARASTFDSRHVHVRHSGGSRDHTCHLVGTVHRGRPQTRQTRSLVRSGPVWATVRLCVALDRKELHTCFSTRISATAWPYFFSPAQMGTVFITCGIGRDGSNMFE